MWDIARRGLKGRKKDTLLLKLVITLAFIFIVTSTVFEASIEKTKSEQRLDLYGEWHAAYLDGDYEILERLKAESEVDKVGSSLIIGKSDKCGVVGTFNKELIDMARFSLYKGRYPEAPNEIMVELNQMSNMNLDLEVGQKINVAITIPRVDGDIGKYVMKLNKEFKERGIKSRYEYYSEINKIMQEIKDIKAITPESGKESYYNIGKILELEAKINKLYDEMQYISIPDYYQHHETPFEQMGDVVVVVSNDYFYYYIRGDEVNPDIIRDKGLIKNQKIILKKEFIITGILQTYTDKWDLGGYKAPNAFVTEEGGKAFADAIYGTTLGDFSDYKMGRNIFLYSSSAIEKLYSNLALNYPNKEVLSEEDKQRIVPNIDFWMYTYGMTDEEIERELEAFDKWNVNRKLDDWRDDSLEGTENLENKMQFNTDNFRRNIFSYPEDSASTEYILTLAIIAVIFIATALAIFQIFLTQMKRRSRKIVLLKSMGATNGQIVKLLLCEGLYLLRTGLFIGVPVGFGLAALIIYAMNNFGGRNLQFHVILYLLTLGIVAGCVALFIGMSVPMIFAVRIPLVGTMSKPPKHKKIKHKDHKSKEIHCQTFSYINRRYFKLNKGKAFISFGISLITITILLSSIFLCYISFDDYKTTVLATNRPDYAMETYFGEATRRISLAKEEIMGIEGIKSTEVYKVGKQTFFWYDDIDENKMIQTFQQLLPDKLLDNHFSSYNAELENEPEWIKNAFYTKIYGIDPKEELFNRYNSAVAEGTVNKEKFAKGEEVILLIPMYLPGDSNIKEAPFGEKKVLDATNEDNRMNWLFDQTSSYKTTYNSRYKDYYYKQEDIKPGDTIYLSSDDEKIVYDTYAISHTTHKVKVGGIVYYFPREGIWPFSNNIAPYVVISSMDGMESIYPNSRLGLQRNTLEQMKDMVDFLYPTRYGRTLWYINTDSTNKDVVLDSKLLGYANNHGYTLYNYKNSNAQLYHEAINNAIIIGLLGLTSAAIACIILYNTMVSKLEQDKNRIGILQSLGVTREQFSRHYLQVGILNGLLAAVIANIILMLVLFLTSLGTAVGLPMSFGDYIKDIFTYRLWLYPWGVHVLVCIIFFVLTVLMHYLPSRNITKQYPVENIRSLGR